MHNVVHMIGRTSVNLTKAIIHPSKQEERHHEYKRKDQAGCSHLPGDRKRHGHVKADLDSVGKEQSRCTEGVAHNADLSRERIDQAALSLRREKQPSGGEERPERLDDQVSHHGVFYANHRVSGENQQAVLEKLEPEENDEKI